MKVHALKFLSLLSIFLNTLQFRSVLISTLFYSAVMTFMQIGTADVTLCLRTWMEFLPGFSTPFIQFVNNSKHKRCKQQIIICLLSFTKIGDRSIVLFYFFLVTNQLDAQNLFYNKFISCLYMFPAPCAYRQEVKIVLYSIWYHHTSRWPSGAQVERGLTCAPDGHLYVWWYQRLHNTILTSWRWAHGARNM